MEVLFARGSGAEAYHSEVYYDLVEAFEQEYKDFGLTYRLTEVDYPAVPVANLQQIFEAYVSAGRAYEFGRSVEAGVQNVLDYRNYIRWKCPDSKFVLVGYSQGAMVVKDAAKEFSADEIGYLLTFGDPETYLPEGEGWFPKACTSSNIDYSLSNYRLYAPECHTYEGLFGGANPYEPDKFHNKYGLVCNEDDFICGSSKNPFRNGGHTAYAGSGRISWAIHEYTDAKLREEWKNLEGLTDRPSVALSSSIMLAGAETSNVAMRRIDGDRLLLTWRAPPGSEYVLVQLNGVVLGYVEAARGELEIRDLDYRVDNQIKVSFLTSDGEITESKIYEPPTIILPLEEETKVQPSEPIDEPPKNDNQEQPSAMNNEQAQTKKREESPTLSDELQPVGEAVDADNYSSPIGSTKNTTRNTLSYVSDGENKSIVKVVVAVAGASAILALFWLSRRR